MPITGTAPILTAVIKADLLADPAKGLPWEIETWRRRKPGRRVECQDGGAVVLIDVLPAEERRAVKREPQDSDELRRTYPSLTAACAAVAL